MQVSKDILMKGIGKIVYNTKNDVVGRIADVTKDGRNKPNHIILSCDKLKGFGSKYFAVPLNRTFVKISRGGKMVLNLKKTDLKKAREIDIDKNDISNSLYKKILKLMHYQRPFRKRTKNNSL